MKKMLCSCLLMLILLFSVGCSAQILPDISPTPTSNPVVSTSPSPTITPTEPTKSPAKTPKKKANVKVKVKVTLVDEYMSYNNHVGNDWYYYSDVNGSKLTIGRSKTVSISTSGRLHLYSQESEEDSSIDLGSTDSYVKVSSLKKGKSVTKKYSVIVTEDRGRYSGNQAKWIFIYRITRY